MSRRHIHRLTYLRHSFTTTHKLVTYELVNSHITMIWVRDSFTRAFTAHLRHSFTTTKHMSWSRLHMSEFLSFWVNEFMSVTSELVTYELVNSHITMMWVRDSFTRAFTSVEYEFVTSYTSRSRLHMGEFMSVICEFVTVRRWYEWIHECSTWVSTYSSTLS